MTGELTLRGRVLPIGGVKEKLLAARRAGIREVILPKKNEVNLQDLPDYVRDGMKIHFVNDVGEAIGIALGIDFDSCCSLMPRQPILPLFPEQQQNMYARSNPFKLVRTISYQKLRCVKPYLSLQNYMA